MVTRRAPGALGIVYTYIDPLWFESLTRTLQIRRARLSDRTGRLACPSRMSSTKPRSHPRSQLLSESMVDPSTRPRVAIPQDNSTLRCRTGRPPLPHCRPPTESLIHEPRCRRKFLPSSSEPVTTAFRRVFLRHLDAPQPPRGPLGAGRRDGRGTAFSRSRCMIHASCFCDMKVNTC